MSAHLESYPLKYSLDNKLLHIHKRVLIILSKYRQLSSYDNESFGVLIGTKSVDEEHYWIDEVTTPLSRDVAGRYVFTMQDSQHQKLVEKSFKNSSGKSVYFGTWHTHPEKYPTPSRIDKDDWRKCRKRNPGRELFFIIAGTEEIRVFLGSNKRFLPMDLMET